MVPEGEKADSASPLLQIDRLLHARCSELMTSKGNNTEEKWPIVCSRFYNQGNVLQERHNYIKMVTILQISHHVLMFFDFTAGVQIQQHMWCHCTACRVLYQVKISESKTQHETEEASWRITERSFRRAAVLEEEQHHKNIISSSNN